MFCFDVYFISRKAVNILIVDLRAKFLDANYEESYVIKVRMTIWENLLFKLFHVFLCLFTFSYSVEDVSIFLVFTLSMIDLQVQDFENFPS